jgi:hypothetical protein
VQPTPNGPHGSQGDGTRDCHGCYGTQTLSHEHYRDDTEYMVKYPFTANSRRPHFDNRQYSWDMSQQMLVLKQTYFREVRVRPSTDLILLKSFYLLFIGINNTSSREILIVYLYYFKTNISLNEA